MNHPFHNISSVFAKTRNTWNNLSKWATPIKVKHLSILTRKLIVKSHKFVWKKYNGSSPRKVRLVKGLYSMRKNHRQTICAVFALWQTALEARFTFRQARCSPEGSWCGRRKCLIAIMGDFQMYVSCTKVWLEDEQWMPHIRDSFDCYRHGHFEQQHQCHHSLLHASTNYY